MYLNGISNISFNGITQIYAIADTHQETRKAAAFLSQILKKPDTKHNKLFLHCGDLYGGIYAKDIERDCYIKMKEAAPNVEMVFTLGNHDFGYDKKGFEYLLDTVQKFTSTGIKIVSANLMDMLGTPLKHVKPYTIIERDGDRNFITGFCTTTLNTQKNDYVKAAKSSDVIDNLISAIEKEKPDNVIILNHDFMDTSSEIVDYCKSKNINVDLVIGGHNHQFVPPDPKRHIYYPETFAEGMYRCDIVNDNGLKDLRNIEEVKNNNEVLDKTFKSFIEEYDKKEGLYEVISKSVLDLPHDYSNPCPYGSFIADSMKNASNTDIAFVSTGFMKHSLRYKKNGNVTQYDFQRSMPTETPVQITEFSADELKKIFEHALRARGYCGGNPRFLQCSNNIKIIGFDNKKEKYFGVKQIFINGEALLDETGKAKDKNKTFSCAIDSYIANGGQQFNLIKEKQKRILEIDNKPSKINEVLKQSLIDASSKYKAGTQYPYFVIEAK